MLLVHVNENLRVLACLLRAKSTSILCHWYCTFEFLHTFSYEENMGFILVRLNFSEKTKLVRNFGAV